MVKWGVFFFFDPRLVWCGVQSGLYFSSCMLLLLLLLFFFFFTFLGLVVVLHCRHLCVLRSHSYTCVCANQGHLLDQQQKEGKQKKKKTHKLVSFLLIGNLCVHMSVARRRSATRTYRVQWKLLCGGTSKNNARLEFQEQERRTFFVGPTLFFPPLRNVGWAVIEGVTPRYKCTVFFRHLFLLFLFSVLCASCPWHNGCTPPLLFIAICRLQWRDLCERSTQSTTCFVSLPLFYSWSVCGIAYRRFYFSLKGEKKKRITHTTCFAFTPQLTSLSFTTPPFLFICFSWLGSTSQSYKQAYTRRRGKEGRKRARKEHKKAFRSHKLDFLINTYF